MSKDKYRRKFRKKIGNSIVPWSGHIASSFYNSNIDLDKIPDKQLKDIVIAVSVEASKLASYYEKKGYNGAMVEVGVTALKKDNY